MDDTWEDSVTQLDAEGLRRDGDRDMLLCAWIWLDDASEDSVAQVDSVDLWAAADLADTCAEVVSDCSVVQLARDDVRTVAQPAWGVEACLLT